MENSFHWGERKAQQQWATESIWDEARKERLLWDHIPLALHARLENIPFFFLATSNSDGHCDCSFKGGGPGLIKVIDEYHFAFPDFDGNGAFMSLGNILTNPQVGCLFIDFEDGARLRVNGRASIHEDDELMVLFPTANRVVRVAVEQVVPNCAQHIPRLINADMNTDTAGEEI